jgi:hypothetical protein
MKFDAKIVLIDGKEYKLGSLCSGTINSKTGFNYYVLNDKGQNFRIVNAYPKGTKVFTSGEHLEFK